MEAAAPRRPYRYHWAQSIPFFGVHVAAVVGIALLGWSWSGFGLAMALYAIRMFGVTAVYHRYFSHRSYKMGRVTQFLMGVLATTSTQKGILWWAAHHRRHHKYSDQPEDIHSVRQDGFWHAHVGWILAKDYEQTEYDKIKDFAKFPELVWLNKLHLVPPIALAVALYLVAGGWGLVWGFFVSTTLLWHGTFTINSLSHVFGKRRYATTDDSKNNWLLALITLGEGWHNNHHHYQRSTAQGFYWWEIDITYYVLKVMSWLGLVSDLHTPPKHVRDQLPKAHTVDAATPAETPAVPVMTDAA
jgi:stearoyl-CoA desaturase (delta-9 desaturase)